MLLELFENDIVGKVMGSNVATAKYNSGRNSYGDRIYLGQMLYIKPSYIVSRAVYDNQAVRSMAQLQTRENLKENKHDGKMSKQTISKLKTSIAWLCHSAKWKPFIIKKINKKFFFKISFVTLTIPFTSSPLNYKTFVKDFLHTFLVYARKAFGLKNYVWKMELQENGNPHIHLACDCFMHYENLRKAWNRILRAKGVLSDYTDRFTKMDLRSYTDYVLANNPKKALIEIENAFNFGVSTGWQEPNSTDIHSTKNIKKLGAYLAKYMVKDASKGEVKVEGNCRVWGCNEALSSAKIAYHAMPDELSEISKSLYSKQIEHKEITTEPDVFGKTMKICDLFLVGAHQWGTTIKGKLNSLMNDCINSIRGNAELFNPNECYVV